jgi:cytoskeletal protein CcmA (bactofilin family)
VFGSRKGNESGVTLIAANCEVTGDVRFSGQLLVNGVVTGNVLAEEGSKALVTISEKGRVKGEVRVPNVIVNGKVFGDIHADQHVELAAKAAVTGDVYYNLIEMVMGSRVDGSLVHVKSANGVKSGSTAVPASAGPVAAERKDWKPAPSTQTVTKTA